MGKRESREGANMGLICVTTDDFRPSLIPLWESTWDKLKEKHKDLKVTIFISPFNKEFSVNEQDNIQDNEIFREWFEKRKEWIFIEPHGFTHEKPPENLRSEEEQERVVRESIFYLRDYIDFDCITWKSPFFRSNKTTTNVLSRCGVKAYDQWYHLSFIEPNKKPIPQHAVIPTHTSVPEGKNPDNINLVYNELDNQLTILEKAGWKYSAYRLLIKEALQ